MERITVIIDKGENVVKEQRTLLFFEHNGLYILYVIADGAKPEHCIGRTNFEDIVTFVESINYDVYDLDNKKVENYLEILQKEMTDSNRTIWMPKK